MKRKRTLAVGIAASIGMLALILDSRTALNGASAGIELCLKTVVPSLFPFFILSILLTRAVTGTRIGFLRSVGKWCGIPVGAESILLVGFLGGYPVGAQCVSQAYAAGQLSKKDARRMLGFCSNAGPAFLFGMVGMLFNSKAAAFVLWGIHILSALLVGIILPGRECATSSAVPKKHVTMGQALQQSVWIMANVCGWVVLFRVILSFADRWFLWFLPQAGRILFSGILELSNGCFDLTSIQDERMRFLLASVFLGFGGVCVGMQTVSVTGQAGLDTGAYFPGKVLQAAISALLAYPAAMFLFPGSARFSPLFILTPLLITIAVLLLLKKRKNNSSIPAPSGV